MKIAIDEVGIDAGFGNVKTIRLGVVDTRETRQGPTSSVYSFIGNCGKPDLRIATLNNPHGFHAYEITA